MMPPPPPAERSLAFPVRPHHDEDILGLIARAASENGYPTTRYVTALADVSAVEVRAGLPRCRSERIAHVLGCPEDAAIVAKAIPYSAGRKGWSNFQGTAVRHSLIVTSERRVSPAGLMQAPYLRAIWQMSVLDFDPQTRELLLSRCPECGRTLKFYGRHPVTHCHSCREPDAEGFSRGAVDLRDYPQPLIEPDDPEALAFLTGLISRDASGIDRARAGLHPPFDQADRGVLFDLIVRIAKAMETSGRPHVGGKRPGGIRAPVNHKLLARAARAILGWPASLEWLEQTFAKECASRTHSVTALFGDLNPALMIGAADETMRGALRAALQAHVRTKWGYSGRSARKDLISKRGAERAYGVSRRSLATWLARDALTMTKMAGAKGRILLDRANVQRLVETRAAHVSRNMAADRLAAPLGCLRSLAEFGLLIEMRSTDRHAEHHPNILLASVDSLESLFTSTQTSEKPSGWIPLSDAVSSLSFLDDCLARSVVAVCEGRLPVWVRSGTRRLFHRALIPSTAALEKALRETFPVPSMRLTRPMSLREIGSALGSYGNTAALLRKAGFLGERTTLDEVLRFKRRYVLTREAVTRLRTAGWKCFGNQPPKDFAMEPIARLQDRRSYVWLRAPMETAIRDGPEVRLPIAPHNSTPFERPAR